MKKTSIISMFLFGAILSSCGQTEKKELFEISTNLQSEDNIVSLSLIKRNQEVHTDILGKERIVHEDITHLGENGLTADITWTIGGTAGGTWTDNTLVVAKGLPSCTNSICGEKSFTSAWQAEKDGKLNIKATGTITDNGKTIKFENTQTSITIGGLDFEEYQLSHTFRVPSRGSNGRPDSLYMSDLITKLNKYKTSSHASFLSTTDNSWTIICDQGYGWKTGADAAWHSGFNIGGTNGFALAKYNQDQSKWYIEEGSSPYIRNGEKINGNELHFEAGCWKLP